MGWFGITTLFLYEYENPCWLQYPSFLIFNNSGHLSCSEDRTRKKRSTNDEKGCKLTWSWILFNWPKIHKSSYCISTLNAVQCLVNNITRLRVHFVWKDPIRILSRKRDLPFQSKMKLWIRWIRSWTGSNGLNLDPDNWNS